jgi:MaoC dehydratase-like protein
MMSPETAEQPEARTAYSAVVGTLEEGRAWIGKSTPPKTGAVPVNTGMIAIFCAILQDGNPRYWPPENSPEAGESPPGLLLTWTMPLPWSPANPLREGPLCVRVPLPGNVVANVKQDTEFYRPLRVGDRLTMVETLTDISDEKSTALGTGHFVTTQAEFRNQTGDLVATMTNTLFRYRSEDGAR